MKNHVGRYSNDDLIYKYRYEIYLDIISHQNVNLCSLCTLISLRKKEEEGRFLSNFCPLLIIEQGRVVGNLTGVSSQFLLTVYL